MKLVGNPCLNGLMRDRFVFGEPYNWEVRNRLVNDLVNDGTSHLFVGPL